MQITESRDECFTDVATIRAKLLDGLAPIDKFAQAIGKCPRTVNLWMAMGLPFVRIGKTPYVRIEAAKDWLTKRSEPQTRRGRGRPRKAA